MNAIIKQLLGEQITISNTKFPVVHLNYKGASKNYVIWTVSSEDPVLSADDKILVTETLVDIDIFSVGNLTTAKEKIFDAFVGGGWYFMGVDSEEYFTETEQYHTSLSFKKERTLSNGKYRS